MPCEFPEHHRSGGGDAGLGPLVAVVAGAAAVVVVVAAIWQWLVAGFACFGVLSLAAAVLYVRHRLRQYAELPVWQRVRHIQPQYQARQVPQAPPQAVEGGQHLHLHLPEGMHPAEVAAYLRQLPHQR